MNYVGRRDANLDLLRAAAISLVLLHHVAQYVENLPPLAHRFTSIGAYGVDLFFVLSGFLIGTLFFRELQVSGTVSLIRFWGRRGLRTLPLYYVSLALAYAAVFAARKQPFESAYLVFAQNYFVSMPFFLVSWSLCVEEHFYFFAPALLLLFSKARIPLGLVFLCFAFTPFALRLIDPSASPETGFGYAQTATHLRFEGLLFGVSIAYLRSIRERFWASAKAFARRTYLLSLVTVLTVPFWSESLIYYVGYLWVSFTFALTLVALVDEKPMAMATFTATTKVAAWSYSIYLTHALVIHGCVWLTDQYQLARSATTPLWFAAIALTGYLVHRLIEQPSLRFRERVVPRGN